MIYDYDVTIIGGGSGGIATAAFASKFGIKIAVIEEDKIGGECTYTGCIPSKAFIHYSLNGQNELTDVFSYVQDKVKKLSKLDKQYLQKDNITVIHGTASFINSHTIKTSEEKIITSHYFVIATGSSPIIPSEYIPLIKKYPEKFISNTTVFTLSSIPQSIIFIGSGFVSAELSQAFARLGSKVTIIARSGKLLSKEDTDISTAITNIFQHQGIEIRTEPLKDEELALYDKIFLGTGRKGNSQNLNLSGIEVKINNSYVVVNNKMQTSVKNIYAIGDVINHFQFTHAARQQAIIAVRNILLPFSRKKFISEKYAWAIFTYPEIAHYGYTEKELQEKNIVYEKILVPFSQTDRGITDENENGFIKVLHEHEKILGVHILGNRASEMIHNYTTPYINLKNLQDGIYVYPTFSTITQDISSQYILKRLNAKVLHFLTKLKI